METLNINNSKIELCNVSPIRHTVITNEVNGIHHLDETKKGSWDDIKLTVAKQLTSDLAKQLQTEEKLYLTTKLGEVEVLVDSIEVDGATINIKPKHCKLIF